MPPLLPPPAKALPYLIVALHCIDGFYLFLIICHCIVRHCKGQLIFFRTRRIRSGKVYVPQARSIVTLAALLTAVLEQVNLVATRKAVVDMRSDWVVTFNSLLNYTWIPLAVASWTLAWAALSHVLIMSERGPSARIINLTLAFIPLIFLIVLIPLFTISEVHLARSVDAGVAGDDAREMSNFADYKRYQKAGIAWVITCEFIFLAVYTPCSIFYVKTYAALYRQQARINDTDTGAGVYIGPTKSTQVKIPLSEISWRRDSRFFLLFAEMILIIFGLLADIATLLWFVSEGAFLTDPIAFAGFFGMLHCASTSSGIMICFLATARLLMPPQFAYPFNGPNFKGSDTEDQMVSNVQQVAFSGLIHEKMAKAVLPDTFLNTSPTSTTDSGADTIDSSANSDSSQTTSTERPLTHATTARESESWLDTQFRPAPPNSEDA